MSNHEPLCVFAIQLPPSLNKYYGVNRKTGKRYVRKAGKSYRYLVLCGVLDGDIPRMGSDPFRVHIDFHPQLQGGDIDNYDKCFFDAMTRAGAWDDDDQIVNRSAAKRAPVDGGALVVTIHKATKADVDNSKTIHPLVKRMILQAQ